MQKFLPIAGVALLAGLAQAQIVSLPNLVGNTPTNRSYFAVHNGISGLTWRTTQFHFQMIYDTQVLTQQGVTGPITINRLKWRAADGVVNAGGSVYSTVNIQMSSSTVDYAVTTANTFATNRGVDNTLVYTGSVTVGACTGGTPNDYVIDIPLTTPFVYDPTLGADLIIEVDASAPAPTTVPNLATSAAIGDLGRRSSAATQAATTGSTSTFASVVWMEFTGPGGVSNVGVARASSYGTGCGDVPGTASSFYENFPGNGTGHTFDLRSTTPGTPNVVNLNNAGPVGYAVSAGTSAWFTPTSTVLTTGDDVNTAPQTLPFTLSHPGGTATQVIGCTNGYVILGGTAPAADFTPTTAELLAQAPRLAIAWFDWNGARNLTTHPNAGLYYDVDPSGQTVYFTWLNFGEFGVTTAGTSVNNFQIAIHSNGNIEYRYDAMPLLTTDTTDNMIVGESRGLGAHDPAGIDISAAMPFVTTGPDQLNLSLAVSVFPILGLTETFTISNIPAAALLSANLLSFGQINPFFDLSPAAPGCGQGIDLTTASTTVLFGGPQVQTSLVLPVDPSFIGAPVFAQAASLVPGFNALNVITSNAWALTLGNF